MVFPLLGLLALGTAYELAVALDWLGSRRSLVEPPAFLGLIAAAAICAIPRLWTPTAALLAPAGAAFTSAYLYTYDSYYAPAHQRYTYSPWPAVVLVGAALVALAVSYASTRAGRNACFFSLLLSFVVGVFAGSGH